MSIESSFKLSALIGGQLVILERLQELIDSIKVTLEKGLFDQLEDGKGHLEDVYAAMHKKVVPDADAQTNGEAQDKQRGEPLA